MLNLLFIYLLFWWISLAILKFLRLNIVKGTVYYILFQKYARMVELFF